MNSIPAEQLDFILQIIEAARREGYEQGKKETETHQDVSSLATSSTTSLRISIPQRSLVIPSSQTSPTPGNKRPFRHEDGLLSLRSLKDVRQSKKVDNKATPPKPTKARMVKETTTPVHQPITPSTQVSEATSVRAHRRDDVSGEKSGGSDTMDRPKRAASNVSSYNELVMQNIRRDIATLKTRRDALVSPNLTTTVASCSPASRERKGIVYIEDSTDDEAATDDGGDHITKNKSSTKVNPPAVALAHRKSVCFKDGSQKIMQLYADTGEWIADHDTQKAAATGYLWEIA